jgi:DNA-binding response OmpR family regulator
MGARRQPTLKVGDLRLDPASRQVWRGETSIALTAKEFALLELLMGRAGEAVSRFELLESVWDGGVAVVEDAEPGACVRITLPVA